MYGTFDLCLGELTFSVLEQKMSTFPVFGRLAKILALLTRTCLCCHQHCCSNVPTAEALTGCPTPHCTLSVAHMRGVIKSASGMLGVGRSVGMLGMLG